MLTDIGGGWYLAKIARGLTPLKRKKLIKKSEERKDYIQKKLYEYNRWWNDWKFQLHWKNIEWVDPKSTPKRVKPYSVSSKKIAVKMIEQIILLVILD